ncbi:hypothetical protein EJ02DRAFT_429220 [Clathrospora elynae]|uniref:DUF6532 domain-containing protein n=1 Tax=Clathrospora elynae TaxID=706981 RepID=A0A6A5S5D1_9PLEO|nr:hypothetical protein EJ02DRAFT_429220 [Clathrospora elynae]
MDRPDPKNESNLTKAKAILTTWLVTGGQTSIGTPITPWVDAHRNLMAELIQRAWTEARVTTPTENRQTIDKRPCEVSARILLDLASDLRTHTIRVARAEANTAYNLGYPDKRPPIHRLLENFDYLTKDTNNPNSFRFSHPGIAATLAKCFYKNGRWGVALMTGTADSFEKMTGHTMALIGTVLYHAIN